MHKQNGAPPDPIQHATTTITTQQRTKLQDLTSILQVIPGQGDFTSKLITTHSIPNNTVLASINLHDPSLTISPKKSYSTIQIGVDKHVDLKDKSLLVYMNHSCAPTVMLDTGTLEVVTLRDLEAGDEITFFYPTTEWVMDHPFQCWCGSRNCIGWVTGASDLTMEQLEPFWEYVAQHVRELIRKRDSAL